MEETAEGQNAGILHGRLQLRTKPTAPPCLTESLSSLGDEYADDCVRKRLLELSPQHGYAYSMIHGMVLKAGCSNTRLGSSLRRDGGCQQVKARDVPHEKDTRGDKEFPLAPVSLPQSLHSCIWPLRCVHAAFLPQVGGPGCGLNP